MAFLRVDDLSLLLTFLLVISVGGMTAWLANGWTRRKPQGHHEHHRRAA